jgi:hypothetical protein
MYQIKNINFIGIYMSIVEIKKHIRNIFDFDNKRYLQVHFQNNTFEIYERIRFGYDNKKQVTSVS